MQLGEQLWALLAKDPSVVGLHEISTRNEVVCVCYRDRFDDM